MDALLPHIDDENRPFWQGAQRGELVLQRCRDTRRLVFPPRSVSPWGERRAPVWEAVSGRGTIWSVVVPHAPLMAQFTELAPYNVVLVALDEDSTVRLVGNVVVEAGAPIDSVDPATIEIGAAVHVVFETVNAEVSMPRWVLV
jgi:uncharacterized OB-fold protein